MHGLIAPAINLVILIGLLVYYTRKPLKNFLESRHAFLRDELKKTSDQLRAAQEQFDEFSAKLKAVQVEVDRIRDQSRQDAEALKLRFSSDTRRLSQAIVNDARAAAESVFGDMQAKVKVELGESIASRTEQLIKERITDQDRGRIRKEFSNQLESMK